MLVLDHLSPSELPMALVALHRSTAPGERVRVRLDRALPGTSRTDLAEGAGFALRRGRTGTVVTLERQWSLPDTVDDRMQMLVVGLNPSPAAADTGIGFQRPGNRFWPAAIAAGIVSEDRNPDHALVHHRLGMTDIVKRTTRRAEELSAAEYYAGLERLRRLVGSLGPERLCFVGLAGWRSAVDRRAIAGWQPEPMAGRPVYLMPSTSGLNASSTVDDLTAHLRRAAGPPPR